METLNIIYNNNFVKEIIFKKSHLFSKKE